MFTAPALAVSRESLLHSLKEEQSVHRQQLKQLQVALKGSLGHIRSLKVRRHLILRCTPLEECKRILLGWQISAYSVLVHQL
jgi:hypothetical protein